jgi:CheY-like chemotaxis protein
MAGSFSLALVGFPENESATFESCFRLAARRPPAYVVQDEVLDAQVLVVNADNAQAVHLVRHAELQGKVLLIGHSDAGTGWPLQRKPVKLVGVLAALDELVGARARPAAELAPPVARPRRRSPDTEFPPTRPMVRERAQPPAPPVLRKAMAPMPATNVQPVGVMRVTDFGALDPVPAPAPATSSRAPSSRSMRSRNSRTSEPVPEVQRGDVLLVAESLVEGRILHKRFKRYGLNIDWSREAPQALALLKEHPYRLVAIDRIKGEADAYSVCRSAKQRKLPNGNAPVVLMFAPTAGSMDRIKAGLAGCDAYLSRSVGEAEFYRVLAQHRLVSLDGFERTNIGF